MTAKVYLCQGRIVNCSLQVRYQYRSPQKVAGGGGSVVGPAGRRQLQGAMGGGRAGKKGAGGRGAEDSSDYGTMSR